MGKFSQWTKGFKMGDSIEMNDGEDNESESDDDCEDETFDDFLGIDSKSISLEASKTQIHFLSYTYHQQLDGPDAPPPDLN